MLTLYFLQKTAFDIDAVPEQWRTHVTVLPLPPQLGITRYRIGVEVQPDDSSYRYRALMQKPQLVLKFSLPFYIEFPVGTYCTYENQKFMLTRSQDLKKQGTRKIEYTMTLGTNENYLGEWKLRNIVDAVELGEDAPKDNRLKFSQCMKPHEFIDLIVRNLNNKDTTFVWSRGECIEASEKTVEFNHAYIDAALADIAKAFDTEYEIVYTSSSTAKINLRRVEYNNNTTDAVELSYGCGNGFIPGVGRTSEADGVPVKRMFTQGTDRNIDRSAYGAPELLMPKSQTIQFDGTHFSTDKDADGNAYALNSSLTRTYQSDEYGESVERIGPTVSDATKEDSLDCSEIYPSREGVVTSVEVINAEKNFYDIIDNTIPDDLNFNNYLIAGETMTIIMQDGMLAGKEFDVKYKHDERRFEIVPQEIDGVVMPNATFCPAEQQKYAIFGIQLPEAYICNNETKTGASWDMMRAAVKSLYENEDQRFTFTGSLQALYAKRHWLDIGGKLIVGGHVLFRDTQFAKDGILIRIVGIKDYLTQPYSPTIELSNSVSASSSTVATQLRQIDNTEVIIEDTKKTMMQYTKRRFRDSLETLGMLEDARIGDFTANISPSAIQTMALLAGDESLQFKFMTRYTTLKPDSSVVYSYIAASNPVTYNNGTKRLVARSSNVMGTLCLRHMTLGQSSALMTQDKRDEGGYMTWVMHNFTSPVLDDPTRSYYLYAKVSSTDTSEVGKFKMSETPIGIDDEAGYYHLLCGVLNSEIEGERSYVSLYGFTEILPGRVTTDLIISNDGQTYFDLTTGEIGGVIKFLTDDPDNPYVTIIDGGKIKTELIDASQIVARSLLVGVKGETHYVQIKPNDEGNGSIRIFDKDDNEVTVLEGVSYNGIGSLYDGSTGDDCTMLTRSTTQYGCVKDVTLGRGTHTYNANGTEVTCDTIVASKTWQTNTPTEVEIKTGYLSALAYSAGYTQQSSSSSGNGLSPTPVLPVEVSSASAYVSVRVETYSTKDETTGALSDKIDTSVIASLSASATATGQMDPYDNDNGTVTYPAKTDSTGQKNMSGKKVRIPAGHHRVVISFVCSASRLGSYATVTWGNTTDSVSDVVTKWICDFYVSRYFANGFCLGTRADNYIIAYKTSDGMRFVMENDKIGFDFSKAGIRTRARGTNWMPLPLLIYKASYNYQSSDDTYEIDSSQGCKTFNGAMLPATHTGKGLVTLTFPASWLTDLGTINVENLLVQVNAYHQVIDCRVQEITTSAIKVAMSDGASLNDGNFSIVIYYLAS